MHTSALLDIGISSGIAESRVKLKGLKATSWGSARTPHGQSSTNRAASHHIDEIMWREMHNMTN